jgi:hypothetical protein
VMAFLYVTYIVLYAVLSAVLGKWVDSQLIATNSTTLAASAREALKYVGGTHFTVLSVVVLASTFIPKGSFALNPKVIDDVQPILDEEIMAAKELDKDISKESQSGDNGIGGDSKAKQPYHV